MARRYLRMTPAEWDQLAWWEQRMYIEGLQADGILGDGRGESGQGTVDNFHGALSSRTGDLAALGFTETTL